MYSEKYFILSATEMKRIHNTVLYYLIYLGLCMIYQYIFRPSGSSLKTVRWRWPSWTAWRTPSCLSSSYTTTSSRILPISGTYSCLSSSYTTTSSRILPISGTYSCLSSNYTTTSSRILPISLYTLDIHSFSSFLGFKITNIKLKDPEMEKSVSVSPFRYLLKSKQQMTIIVYKHI